MDRKRLTTRLEGIYVWLCTRAHTLAIRVGIIQTLCIMGIQYVQMPEALQRLHIAEPGRGLITALTASSNVCAHL